MTMKWIVDPGPAKRTFRWTLKGVEGLAFISKGKVWVGLLTPCCSILFYSDAFTCPACQKDAALKHSWEGGYPWTGGLGPLVQSVHSDYRDLFSDSRFGAWCRALGASSCEPLEGVLFGSELQARFQDLADSLWGLEASIDLTSRVAQTYDGMEAEEQDLWDGQATRLHALCGLLSGGEE